MAAAAGLAGLAGVTRPFTAASDAVVATALAGALVGIGAQSAGRAPAWIARRPGAWRRPAAALWGWALVAAAVAAWEVGSFLATPRAAHPTISSMLDAVDRNPTGRGLAFAAWLALGWFLVTR